MAPQEMLQGENENTRNKTKPTTVRRTCTWVLGFRYNMRGSGQDRTLRIFLQLSSLRTMMARDSATTDAPVSAEEMRAEGGAINLGNSSSMPEQNLDKIGFIQLSKNMTCLVNPSKEMVKRGENDVCHKIWVRQPALESLVQSDYKLLTTDWLVASQKTACRM